MPGVEVLTAIFPHPEGPCQPKDRQTEHKVEELRHKHHGKDIPYFAVKTDYLHHQVADHKQATKRTLTRGPSQMPATPLRSATNIRIEMLRSEVVSTCPKIFHSLCCWFMKVFSRSMLCYTLLFAETERVHQAISFNMLYRA